MVVVAFLMMDKANRIRFCKKIFLVANVSPEIVFEMTFLTRSSADIDFLGWELWWRTYTTKEAFATIRYVKLVGKKDFIAATLNPEYEIFVVYVASLRFTLIDVRPQISVLIAEEASIKIPAKHSNFADVFSPDLASKFFEQIEINDHAIKLVDGQQSLYKPIHSLRLIKLKILKA